MNTDLIINNERQDCKICIMCVGGRELLGGGGGMKEIKVRGLMDFICLYEIERETS
jgi:hypothetical protein